MSMMPFPAALRAIMVAPHVGGTCYDTVEALSPVVIVNTTAADKLTFTPSLTSGRTYLFLWTADCVTNTAAQQAHFAFTVNGATVDDQVKQATSGSGVTKDTLSFGGMAFYTATGSNVPFAIQAFTGGSGSLTIQNLRISYVVLDSDHDYTTTSLALQSVFSTSFTTAATLSFSDTGNYVALISFDLGGNQPEACWQLTDGTTTITQSPTAESTSISRRNPHLVMIDMGAVSGSKSVTVKVKSLVGTEMDIRNIRVLALRLNRFPNSYKTTLGSANNGTETSYTSALSQTFTPTAARHFSIATWGGGTSSLVQPFYSRYLDDATTVGENNNQAQGTGTGWLPNFAHQMATYAASSHTQTIDRHAETSNTAGIAAQAMILTLELSEAVCAASAGFQLLEDGVSKQLLEDGTSKQLLES